MNCRPSDAAAAGAAHVFNLLDRLGQLPPGELYQRLVQIFEASIAACARDNIPFSDN